MPIPPPIGLPCWAAHTPSDDNPNWNPLPDHTKNVAERAAEFAAAFDATDIAHYLGLLHDLGKWSNEFQEYLLACYQRPNNPPPKGSAPHKQAGALQAILNDTRFGEMLAIPLLGHHGGMKSKAETPLKAKEKATLEKNAALLQRVQAVAPPLLTAPPDSSWTQRLKSPESAEMFLRLLFSCLTDADGLDTERHKQPAAAVTRTQPLPTLATMWEALVAAMENKMQDAPPTPVNAVRREVYDACLRAAELPPGVFSLTVPTGGGKTLASLSFALNHAVKNKLRRIIYAIPYTSIVDQTAGVFREIFKNLPGAVLEHHSAIEASPDFYEDEETADAAEQWRRLAAQNWDAPLIVTTTVQLFESLFSNRPARCRKLHRLVGSIIVLDEVQTLPPTLLRPILTGLKILAEEYDITVVLCTATQPALSVQSEFLQGFSQITPIVADADRDRHFTALRRVTYRTEPEPWDWESVAAEMTKSGDSCLCVVNTRRQAQALLEVLAPNKNKDDVWHLSTLLCGKHRQHVLREVRQRLQNGPPILLVSTQVIECGCDLDFPKALRALGPLDRMIQAAGRCNREGLRPVESSEVVLFRPLEDRAPHGTYRMAQDQTQRWLLAGKLGDLHDPALVTEWFAQLYEDLQGKTDGNDVMPCLKYFDYPETAKRLRLIDTETRPVFITDWEPTQDEARALLREITARGKMTRDLWRRAQPFCVNLYHWDADPEKSPVEEVLPDSGLWLWKGEYDDVCGVPLTDDPADAVIYRPDKLMA